MVTPPPSNPRHDVGYPSKLLSSAGLAKEPNSCPPTSLSVRVQSAVGSGYTHRSKPMIGAALNSLYEWLRRDSDTTYALFGNPFLHSFHRARYSHRNAFAFRLLSWWTNPLGSGSCGVSHVGDWRRWQSAPRGLPGSRALIRIRHPTLNTRDSCRALRMVGFPCGAYTFLPGLVNTRPVRCIPRDGVDLVGSPAWPHGPYLHKPKRHAHAPTRLVLNACPSRPVPTRPSDRLPIRNGGDLAATPDALEAFRFLETFLRPSVSVVKLF